MNMISTGSFQTETGASNKQSELVKKLTAAWEKKNSNTARAGGASLMALSLAACGGEDNTPFSQADVDAAKAEGIASVDITSDNAEAMTSNDAEIAAAAKTEALTAANGTIYATVDAAYTAGSNTSNSDAITGALTAADGTVYATVDAAVSAGAAGVDITTDNQAAIDAELAGTGFASVADLHTAYTDAVATTPALNQALETTQDIVQGTVNDDAITGTNLTYGATDVIIGGDGTDSVTINSTAATVSAAATIVGVENITYNITSADLAIAAVTLTNVDTGTVTVNQLANGANTGASITDAGDINLVFGGKITGTATVGQIAASNLTIDAGTAGTVNVTGGTTGSATVTGTAATFVDADVAVGATGSVTITGGSGLAAVDADATTIAVTTTNASSDITLTGTSTDASDSATLSIGAAAAITNAGANAVETVTISTGTKAGDGTQTAASVATFDTTAATTYNLTGANDIVLAGDEAMFDGKTVTSDATGAASLRLTTVATSDLEAVANGVTIEVAEADALDVASGYTLTVKNNATVAITVDIDSVADGTDDDLTIDSDTLSLGDETLNLVYKASQTDVTNGVDVSDFETVNLSTTGATAALSIGNITAAAGTDVTMASGDKAITFNGLTADTFDATGYTGDITMTVNDATLGTSATFGAGDDAITMTSADALVIDGGDGVDQLNLGANATTATISNFEILKIIDGDTQLKASQLSGQALSIKGTNGTDDDINIDTGVAGSWDLASVNLSALNFDSNVTEVDMVIAAGSIAASLGLGTNFSVTGSSLVDNLTASTVSGDMTVSGLGGADVIVTGSGDDTITGGEGGDTITGGTGSDSINLSESTAAGDDVQFGATDSIETAYDSITGFSAIAGGTADTLTFTGVAGDHTANVAIGSAVDVKAAISGGAGTETVSAYVTDAVIKLTGADAGLIDTLAEWIDVAETAGVIADEDVAAFELGGNTYVVQVDADASTSVIELVDLTGILAVNDTTAAAHTILIA